MTAIGSYPVSQNTFAAKQGMLGFLVRILNTSGRSFAFNTALNGGCMAAGLLLHLISGISSEPARNAAGTAPMENLAHEGGSPEIYLISLFFAIILLIRFAYRTMATHTYQD